MTALVLSAIIALAASHSSGHLGQGDGTSPADGSLTAPVGGVLRGTATWYCGAGSACTRGYGPQDLVAAIDPTTGIARGTRLTVSHAGRSVTVRVVDVCACAGRRLIDLTRGAFSRLADPSAGVIAVTIRTAGDAPAPTLPPTDTLEVSP